MQIKIIRKSVKNLILKIRPNGEIEVTAPKKLNENYIRDFILRKTPWIEKKLKEIEKRKTKEISYLNGEKIFYLGKEYNFFVEKNGKNYVEKRDSENKIILFTKFPDDFEMKKEIVNSWYREEGKKVIVTTSTHLQTPPEEIRAWNIEEVRSLWKSDQIAVIGTDCESNKNLAAGDQAAVNQMENKKSVKKMRMPGGSFLQEVLQEAEVVLIEADGAKHLPCKVPIEKEPVIIPECTDVIAVVGMDALGKPLEEVCFRKDLAVQFLNTSYKHLMAEEDIAKILSSVQGARKGVEDRKYCVVLNKCDDEIRKERAEKIRSLLKEKSIENVMITSCENRQNELKKYF